MGKSVVVYVTRTGNSRYLAEQAAAALGADIHGIEDKIDRRGAVGVMRAMVHTVLGRATAIGDHGIDLNGVDTVVIVQPLWAMGVCPPIRTWMRSCITELEGKRVGLLASNHGSPAGVLKILFEREFCKLASFACIPQGRRPEVKEESVKQFVAILQG